jgi:hypothetical protein
MTTPFFVAPNVENYRVGRGYVTMGTAGSTSPSTDLGNCTKFELKLDPTLLKHFSSRQGTQKMDASAITRLEAELDMVLEDINGQNVALWALDATPASTGPISISLFNQPKIEVSLNFNDTSSFGPTVDILFPKVLLTPKDVLSLIADGSGDWSKLSITALVEYDNTHNEFAIVSMTGST